MRSALISTYAVLYNTENVGAGMRSCLIPLKADALEPQMPTLLPRPAAPRNASVLGRAITWHHFSSLLLRCSVSHWLFLLWWTVRNRLSAC